MKKIASISLAILAILGGFIAYLIYSERMMARLPVIIKKNPKITFISGSAYYRTSVAGRWNQAMVGQKLQTGYEVKTDKNSQMDIRFHNDMAIRVSDNSIMKIDDLTVRKVFINMSRGSIYGKFEKLFKEYSINVQTPTTIAAVRGTELGFETGKEATTVYSLSGITEIYNPKFKDQRVLLSYQNKLAVKENDPPSNPEKLTEYEVTKIRSILNSIHTEEVLFISYKINFEVGSSKILRNSYDELDTIVQIMKEKKVRIRIEGHTDSQGPAAFNQALSVRRADSIKMYFVGKGINPELLETAGYGLSKPIASNKSKQGRAVNRRVEFIIAE